MDNAYAQLQTQMQMHDKAAEEDVKSAAAEDEESEATLDGLMMFYSLLLPQNLSGL